MREPASLTQDTRLVGSSQDLLQPEPSAQPEAGSAAWKEYGPGGLSARSPEFLPHLVGPPSRHLTPTQLASDLQRSTPQALSPAAWVSSPHNPQEVSSQPRPQVASGE